MTRRLLFALPLLGLFCGPASAQTLEEDNRESHRAPAGEKKGSPDLSKAVELIVNKTNAFREKEKRHAVNPNDKLTATAQYFADYLASHDEFSHTADGNTPAQRAKKHGYDFCIVAENIAYVYNSQGFTTEQLAEEFVKGWEHSPEHRRNMLDPEVFDVGVAIARSEKTGYYYAVQDFGRPHSKAIKFEIENRSDETVSYAIGKQTFDLPPRVIRTHTRCRPAEVKFRWPDEKEPSATIKPANGDQFAVTKSGGKFAVKKE